MSNTPGISPITPDVEDVRHSDGDGFFGDEGERPSDAEEPGEEGLADPEEGRRSSAET